MNNYIIVIIVVIITITFIKNSNDNVLLKKIYFSPAVLKSL